MQVNEIMILRHIVHEVSADQPHQTPKFLFDKWSTQEDILESYSAIHSTAQCHGRQPIVASFCRSYELIAFHWLQTKAFFFFKLLTPGGRFWELLVFVYFLSQAAPQTTWLMRPQALFSSSEAFKALILSRGFYLAVTYSIFKESSVVCSTRLCKCYFFRAVGKSTFNKEAAVLTKDPFEKDVECCVYWKDEKGQWGKPSHFIGWHFRWHSWLNGGIQNLRSWLQLP